MQQLAVLVPVAAHFLATADVGDGIHHAAVEQAHRSLVEIRVHRHAVAAIGVLEQRALAILLVALAVDQRHRHLHAIARGDPDAVGFVLRRVIADHRLHLQLATLPGGGVQFEHGGGGGHRGVDVAQPGRIGLGVVAQAHRVRRLVGLHVVAAAILEQQADAFQALGAFGDGGVAIEQFEAFDEHRIVVRDPVLPLRTRGRIGRCGDQLEVLRTVIGADHPAAIVVVGVVLDIALARRQHGEVGRVAGRRVTLFRGHGAVHADGDEAIVAGAADAHVEAVVLLFVDDGVGAGRGAQHVLLHAHGQQRFRIVLDVQHGAVVVGPDQVARAAGDHIGQHLAGGQVLEADGVLAAADIIIGPGQQLVVLADFHRADAEIALAGSHRVDVQQDFLGGLHAALAACVDRVVLAGFEAAVVPVATLARRHAGIVLLDAADDLLVKGVFQRLQRRQQLVGIGILGLQVGQHVLVPALVVAQPVIVIVAGRAERRLDHMRMLGGIRRNGRSGGGGSGGHQAGKQQAEGGIHEIGLLEGQCNGVLAPESGLRKDGGQPCGTSWWPCLSVVPAAGRHPHGLRVGRLPASGRHCQSA